MLAVVSLLARALLHSSTYQMTFQSQLKKAEVVISKTTAQFPCIADPILIDLHLYKVLLLHLQSLV